MVGKDYKKELIRTALEGFHFHMAEAEVFRKVLLEAGYEFPTNGSACIAASDHASSVNDAEECRETPKYTELQQKIIDVLSKHKRQMFPDVIAVEVSKHGQKEYSTNDISSYLNKMRKKGFVLPESVTVNNTKKNLWSLQEWNDENKKIKPEYTYEEK